MLSKFTLTALALTAASAMAYVIWPDPQSASQRQQIADIADVFEQGEEFQFDPPAPGSYPLHRIKPAPDGIVLDVEGQRHSLRDLTKDKISLVSFVYLNCGDVNGCPLAMSTLFDIYDGSAQIPALREDVQLITISFDPDRDTVEAINAFAYPMQQDEEAQKKLNWRVLTTSGLSDLQPILDGYGQVVDPSNDQEKINHLLRMFLVDKSGQIRNIYGLGLIDPRLLMTDVETLLMEEGRG